MGRLLTAIVLAFVIVAAAARVAYTLSVSPGDQPVNEPWSQDRMEFVAWNGGQWTARIQGERFQLVPQDEENWSRHANTSLAYVNWDGEPWQAKLDGDRFLLVHRGNWDGEVVVTEAVRYRDWSGNEQLRTIADIRR